MVRVMKNNYNSMRRNLLLDIDQKKRVDNKELAMYDLTPYLKENNEPDLYETIIFNKNQQRKVEHSLKDIYFSAPQCEALQYLYDNDRVLFSAPTSFGKTMIVKEYIFKYKPNNIIYIVPTNALAYELEKSFKDNEKFSDYLIYDKLLSDSNVDEKKMLFIGTQEKYLEINSSLYGDIDLFVIDEAYKLQEPIDNIRSYRLSETFLTSFMLKSKKIFLLSPNAEFEGFSKYNFEEYSTDFNAVEKNFIVLDKNIFYDEFLRISKDSKSILFCKSPNQINETYYEMKDKIENLSPINDDDFLNQLEHDIHPDWSVVKLLKHGIVTHHGQMPKYVQNKMINLFNKNDNYNILIGTNSISEGINTVTKNLFINPENSDCERLLLKNTIGRAGRLGEYPVGYIYSINDIKNVVDDKVKVILAISDDNELKEIEESKDESKILEFCIKNDIDEGTCKYLINKYKLSLLKMQRILDALKKDYCYYPDIGNLPYIALKAFGYSDYNSNVEYDKLLIRGYLQSFYMNGKTRKYINTFSDSLEYFKFKYKEEYKEDLDLSTIINIYMQFIYATLEYKIMPIVNIGLDLRDRNKKWSFGKNIVESLEDCKHKYYKKNYGLLDIDKMTEEHKRIISAMKDYGMIGSLKNISSEILDEIQNRLNIRFSTNDVINAIDYLSVHSKNNKSFFKTLKNKYMY